MSENNKYEFITDYAIGNYDWVTDATNPSESFLTIPENKNFTYTFGSYNSSLDLTIPYF